MPIPRCLSIALLMTGCTFEPPAAGGGGSGGEEDVPPVTTPTPRHCGTAESGLALCIDFEDTSLAQLAADGSQYRNDAAASNVTTLTRIPGEQAAQLTSTSTLRVPESAMLDLQQFTMEMWMRPEVEPADRREAGLLHNFGWYSLAFEHKRQIRCGVIPAFTTTTTTATTSATVPLNAWSHVACRYDGAQLRIYINGHLEQCQSVSAQLGFASSAGSSIGARLQFTGPTQSLQLVDHYIGGVDNVRVYSRPLADADLCAAAGQPAGTCNTECPGE